MRRHPRSLNAAAALALTLVPFQAGAQVFTGAPSFPGAVPALASPAPSPAPVPAPPEAPAGVIRHLPNTLDGLRLSGEVGDLRWPVYLTAAQAAGATRFRLGHLSAVSVLPEASTLEVRVNDAAIGTAAIDASQGLRVLDFAVPAGLLRPGFNAVSLAVRQRHRVDCSVAATYELWTRIDPAETGFVMAGGAQAITALADLPALLPRADGSMPIHIVMVGKTNPVHLGHLIAATQRIALATRAQQPAVDFGSSVTDAYGVNLALGTREALGRIPQLADLLGAAGPLATLLPATAKGRPTLLVTGSSEAEVEEAVATLPLPEPPGTPSAGTPAGTSAGLAAAASYPATPTEGGGRLLLREAGVASQDFAGRFFRKSFNLRLPADFLSSDYGRGTFGFAGGYAAGLTRDAQVRVDVNGRSAGVIKLPNPGGDVFKNKQLFLPLSLLRPGLNRVDVFAETPRAADKDCSAPDTKRFLLLDTSDLALPTLARVERMPDLAATASGGLPYTRGRARLVVPKPDRDTMAAALSLTARVAVAAGRPVPFAFSTAMPADDAGSTLVVAPARALDPAVMANVGLDPRAVEASWRDFVAPPAPGEENGSSPRWWLGTGDGPAACRPPQPASHPPIAAAVTPAAPSITPAVAESDDLLDRWSGRRTAPSWRERVAAAAAGTSRWVGTAGATVHWPHLAREAGLMPNDSLALAQASTAAGNVTTIVTAPDGATLRQSVGCLFDPQVMAQVHGRLATLDASRGTVTATDATTFRYATSGPLSLGNARLVLAGWFSLNPAAFVGVALLSALCLSGSTLWFVRGVGRRPE